MTRHAVDAWEPNEHVSINSGGGPVRVTHEGDDPEFRPRPAGFMAIAPHLRATREDLGLAPAPRPPMPRLWQDQGDQA